MSNRSTDGLRIALLTDGLFPYVVGGIQRHSRLLAEHLAREGVGLTVYHTARLTAPAGLDARAPDLPADPWRLIRVRFVEYPRPGRYPGHFLRDSWRYSDALVQALMADRAAIDFIYAQGLTGLAFVAARKRHANLPPVGINAHGYEMFQKPATLRARLEQMLLRTPVATMSRDADAVFTFSGHIRDIVENRLGISKSRICEAPNGIDASWIVKTPTVCHAPRRFVFVGRHDRRKGLPELLAAIRLLPPGVAELHVVGPVPAAAFAGLSNVIGHGSVTESAALQQILDQADVLMCPSHSEGMPTVILEAMARGLAIVATDVGAVRSMVESDNGIILAEPTPRAIAEAMMQFGSSSDQELDEMKRCSLRRVWAYEWSRVAQQTIREIERVLSASNDSRC